MNARDTISGHGWQALDGGVLVTKQGLEWGGNSMNLLQGGFQGGLVGVLRSELLGGSRKGCMVGLGEGFMLAPR